MSGPADVLARRLARLRAVETRIQAALLAADGQNPRLEEVVAMLQRLWKDRAGQFWTEPHPVLDGLSPRDMALQNDEGRGRVVGLLGIIEYGGVL